jgi:hypothetical protein
MGDSVITTIPHRVVSCTVLSLALVMAVQTHGVWTSGPTFHDDDPISREPESQDASGVQPWDIGLLYELSYNLAVASRHVPSNTRAANVNTIDEVPDSSWFTNRVGTQTVTADEIERGPNVGTPPAPERWTIVREKATGVNPGFTATDANGETWFITFDSPSNPEGGSGAMVISSKLFWALGYNQVETFVTSVNPATLDIDRSATKKRPSGDRTPFTRDDVREVLERAARNPDGTYRVAAGRLLPGKILGGFRYEGTRPDDPNDIVPHEHRRELRALRVFGAWLNLTDLKAGNTLDTLVVENGRSIVKHVLQDVGSTFGIGQGARDYSIGYEYFYEGGASRRRLATFGLALSPWQTVPYREYPAIGRFEGDHFDPTAWKPHTPTTAYMEMRADDAFWAAMRVMAFDDDLIRAAVRTGEYSDEAAQQYLASVLMKRRDAIGRAYLPAVNPIVSPKLDQKGTLTFENAAVARGVAQPPSRYRAEWFWFDNATGESTRIGETQASSTAIAPVPGISGGTQRFLRVDIAADSAEHPTWRQPIRTHFRATSSGWQLVGLERLPSSPVQSASRNGR